MATLQLDKVKNAGLIYQGQQLRVTRGGLVKGLDLTSTPDKEALLKVLTVTGMPAMNDPLDPVYWPGLHLSRIRVDPIDKDNVYLSLDYETPGGFTPSVFIIRDDGALQTRQESILPTGVPIRSSLQTNAGYIVGPVTVPLRFLRPVRSVSITAMFYGRPASSAGDWLGYVNNTTWPAVPTSAPGVRPLNAGWWLLTRYTSTFFPYNGYYLVEAQASTRVICDWSESDLIRDEFGKYVDGISNSDIADILAKPYQPYVIFGVLVGVARACGYPWTSFSSIFGF